jgi:replicative DNA helicase
MPVKAQRQEKQKKVGSSLRVPPQNIEAEESLLGGLLVDPESINKVVDIITPEDFYRDIHSKNIELILALYENNEPVDIITVASLARDKGLMEKIGGITYLNNLVDLMPSAANITYYAKIIREKALLRNVMNVAAEIIEKGYEIDTNVEGFVDDAES